MKMNHRHSIPEQRATVRRGNDTIAAIFNHLSTNEMNDEKQGFSDRVYDDEVFKLSPNLTIKSLSVRVHELVREPKH